MARKKEIMELENPVVEKNTPADENPTDAAVFENAEDSQLPEAGKDGIDLNELLGSMDQSSAQEQAFQEETLPELTEEEIFGETSENFGNAADMADIEEGSKETKEKTEEDAPPENEVSTGKTRRTIRKKKDNQPQPEESAGEASETKEENAENAEPVAPAVPRTASSSSRAAGRGRKAEAPVLTLETRGEVETEESREDAIWHEIHNAYRTRRILTGQLGGIEQTDNGKTIAIVDYKGFRIVIPLKEMMINVGRSPSGQEYTELMLRQNKILGNMLGAEIDFIVKGIDSKSRSVVASRREAMFKKRQIFYMDTDAAGMYRIYEGRIAQARVIAVAEKVIRVEIFGVECSIMARDLAWDWIGDAHERFSVGDQVLVRILNVRRDSLEDIGIKADIKSVSQNTNHDNLKKCRIQSKYAGKVTDVHKGVVYIRLSNGVNAVAHSCYDYRTPGKKDDVSFAVTRLDEERGVAVGIITRIIRQNL